MIVRTEEEIGKYANMILKFVEDSPEFNDLNFSDLIMVLATCIYLIGYGRALPKGENNVLNHNE